MKIIKAGKKEFIGNCRRCGCEFSYTLEEFLAQYPFDSIPCPECGHRCYHPDQSNSYSETLSDYATEEGIKDALNGFKQFSEGKHIDDSDWSYHPTITRCPVCGGNMVVDDSVVLTSNPPQYLWRCPKCGHEESHFCNGVMITKQNLSNYCSGCDACHERGDDYYQDKDGDWMMRCYDCPLWERREE